METLSSIVKSYTPRVKKMARQMRARHRWTIPCDDLQQAGLMGVMRAYEKYDDNRGVPFEPFADTWARGAMRMAAREERRQQRIWRAAAEAADEAYEGEVARGCKGPSVATAADVLRQVVLKMQETYLVVEGELDEPASPETPMLEREARDELVDLLNQMSADDREYIRLRYFHDVSVNEIAKRFGVHKSVMSRRGTKAAEQLRAALERLWER